MKDTRTYYKQQKYIQTLKDELQRRTASGEVNLSIRYIKGIPKIISTDEHPPTQAQTSKN